MKNWLFYPSLAILTAWVPQKKWKGSSLHDGVTSDSPGQPLGYTLQPFSWAKPLSVADAFHF